MRRRAPIIVQFHGQQQGKVICYGSCWRFVFHDIVRGRKSGSLNLALGCDGRQRNEGVRPVSNHGLKATGYGFQSAQMFVLPLKCRNAWACPYIPVHRKGRHRGNGKDLQAANGNGMLASLARYFDFARRILQVRCCMIGIEVKSYAVPSVKRMVRPGIT